MEITQYRAEALLGSRDVSRDPPKSLPRGPIEEISAIARQAGQQAAPDEDQSLFDVVLDTVNPLQHLPGVSSAYQTVTGDKSSALANMAGGFLFGGPVGLAAGAANSFLEMLTGKSVMGHAMAMFTGEDDAGAATAHVKTGDGQVVDPMLPTSAALGVQQYQAFANAQAEQNKGIGSEARDVNWAANILTADALKQASGLYENNQSLGDKQKQHANSNV